MVCALVMDGEQGDRVLFHYPRLQADAGLVGGGGRVGIAPGTDSVSVSCFRALPG